MADPLLILASVVTLTIQYILSIWYLKDDEYQSSYNDQPVDEHGVQQKEAPEEEEEEVGGDEQQEEDKEATAQGSQVFETETVRWGPPYNTLHFLLLWID